MSPSERVTSAGFTLLEVLVALVIVALGMSALLTALNESARNISALRERTVAEWIAMNQVALARLAFTAPALGTTQGDVIDCANSDWHWQQQVAPVNAIPGLMSIVVRVRRSGATTEREAESAAASSASGASGATTTPGLSGAAPALGPTIQLGPSGPLGSVRTLTSGGCASVAAPGESLGTPGLAGTGPQSEPGASSLAGPTLAGPSLEGSNAASGGAFPGVAGDGAGAPAAGSDALGAGASASAADPSGMLVHISDAGKDQHWLVTLVGFRGNSLAPASGESPDWTGSAFPGNSNGQSNGSAPGTPGSPAPGATGLGTPFSDAPAQPPALGSGTP